MFGMKKKAENKVAQDSKNSMKRPTNEISEDVLRQIVGGRNGDAREGISEANCQSGLCG